MKKSLLLLTALISMFYYAESAKAGFMIDPHVGMAFNSTGEYGGADVDVTGTSVGARLGIYNMGFMVGVDGRRNSWNLDFESGADSDWTYTQLGFLVGYDFPMMLRVWGEYIMSIQADNDDNDNILKEGSGTLIGFGYKVLPFVSLNFEVSNLKTEKIDDGDGNETDLEVEVTAYTVGVSIPFSF